MPEKYRTSTVDPSVTHVDCSPTDGGGWRVGQRAVVRTFNRDGSVTEQTCVYSDGAWHKEGSPRTSPVPAKRHV